MDSQLFSIEPAIQEDLTAIVAIYNQAIRSKQSTAHTDEFTVEQRIEWFNQFDPDHYPIYVVKKNKEVIGYGTISPYRPGRKALEKVAEISFYLDSSHLGQGVGSALLKHMLADCKRIRKETLLAILLDVNVQSIQLLKKFSFEQWGHLPINSDFDGIRYGHLIYGLNLR